MSRLGRYLAGLKPVGLVAGGVLWVVWLVSIALGSGNLDRNGQLIGADHVAFHAAAQVVLDGRGDELFQFPKVPAIAERQQEIAGKAYFNPFRNPPPYAVLYIPTARLPYLVSYSIWVGISFLALVGGLWSVCGRSFASALVWSLSFYPVFATISFGQNSLISVGIFGLVYACLRRDRLFVAGLAAGLLLFKPQLLFGLGLWWLLDFRRCWPSLIGLGCAAIAFASVSWIVLPDATAAWVRNLPEIARYDAFEFYNLHNLRGFGALLTDDKSTGNWFGLAGLLLMSAWFFRFWRRHRQDREIMFAMAIFATLFGSPHTMVYEWSLIILAGAVLWQSRPDLRSEWMSLFSLTWVVFFVSTPFTKLQHEWTGHAVQVSVPIMAFVAWKTQRLLALPPSIQCGT